MKRLLIAIFLLFASTAWAGGITATGVTGQGVTTGVAAAASCSSCGAGLLIDSINGSTHDGNESSSINPYWYAWQFTTTDTKCATGIYAYITDVGSPTQYQKGEIWTDVAGSPGALVGAGFTVTSAAASAPDTANKADFLFAAIQTLPAGTYWVMLKMYTPGGSDHYISTITTGTGTFKKSTDGTTWNTGGKYLMGVYGCSP
jgi:hypothetical protein